MTQKLGPKQQEWVDALRSGKYQQGRSYLHKEVNGNHEYCCLGVLCELNKDDLEVENIKRKPIHLYDNQISFLPLKIVDRYHFYGCAGDSISGLDKNLIYLNDIHYSFSEIADIIEANPSEYFKEEY